MPPFREVWLHTEVDLSLCTASLLVAVHIEDISLVVLKEPYPWKTLRNHIELLRSEVICSSWTTCTWKTSLTSESWSCHSCASWTSTRRTSGSGSGCRWSCRSNAYCNYCCDDKKLFHSEKIRDKKKIRSSWYSQREHQWKHYMNFHVFLSLNLMTYRSPYFMYSFLVLKSTMYIA